MACGLSTDFEQALIILRFSRAHCLKFGCSQAWLVSALEAVQQHRADVFSWLLQDTSDINLKTAEGTTILHAVLKYNFSDIYPLSDLITQGADSNLRDSQGLTALHLAAQLGKVHAVKTLLANNASVVIEDESANSVLHTAVFHSEILSCFLQQSSLKNLINRRNCKGQTPLAQAAALGYPEAVQQLLLAGADPYVVDAQMRTSLHLAASGHKDGHLKALSLLLSMTKLLDLVDDHGNTPLHASIIAQAMQESPDVKPCQLLIAAGANLEIANNNGDLPLFLVLSLLPKQPALDMLSYLANHGANMAARDDKSLTVLHISALYGEAELTLKLLQCGMAPDLAGNEDFGTPLQCCAEVSFLYVSTDTWRKYNYKWRAFFRHPQSGLVAKYLLDAGASILMDFGSHSSLGDSSLLAAVLRQSFDARVAVNFVNYHHQSLNGESGPQHLKILQECFDYAVSMGTRYAVHEYLLRMIPVDMSSLITEIGLQVLAEALYCENADIIQSYLEPRPLLRFQQSEVQTSPTIGSVSALTRPLSLTTEVPPLWKTMYESESIQKVLINKLLDCAKDTMCRTVGHQGITNIPHNRIIISVGRNLETRFATSDRCYRSHDADGNTLPLKDWVLLDLRPTSIRTTKTEPDGEASSTDTETTLPPIYTRPLADNKHTSLGI